MDLKILDPQHFKSMVKVHHMPILDFNVEEYLSLKNHVFINDVMITLKVLRCSLFNHIKVSWLNFTKH